MRQSAEVLNPSQAARRLGVSVKALRLYEKRGLLTPKRTAAGWRAYGPDEIARAAEVVRLRALGLSLAQVARALGDEPGALGPALAAHQADLEGRLRALAALVDQVNGVRTDLASDPARPEAPCVAFDLPWPWGGERFELRDISALTYLTGPLGCGKTRLALRLAETLPGGAFLGLDRAADGAAAARARLDADPALRERVEAALRSLIAAGASSSDAMIALLVGFEDQGPDALVVDMVEQGLDAASQAAVIARLRRRGPGARPLVLMTRSTAILDLAAVGSDEAILYCPANHSPPIRVTPRAGAPGYEGVASCLASPAVRARTAGMRALMV